MIGFLGFVVVFIKLFVIFKDKCKQGIDTLKNISPFKNSGSLALLHSLVLLLSCVTAQPVSYLSCMHSKLNHLCSPSLKTMQLPLFADCGAGTVTKLVRSSEKHILIFRSNSDWNTLMPSGVNVSFESSC